jgi:large subunit ribosomal protein L37
VFVNYAPENVQNLFAEPVTENQIESRSLLKGFTVAAAKAQQMYGQDVKALPQPITVQIVQTDSSFFHFSIFQLNTLDLDSQENGRGLKNLWFNKPKIDLFAECDYKVGKPVMSGYNRDVLRHFQVFYNSV